MVAVTVVSLSMFDTCFYLVAKGSRTLHSASMNSVDSAAELRLDCAVSRLMIRVTLVLARGALTWHKEASRQHCNEPGPLLGSVPARRERSWALCSSGYWRTAKCSFNTRGAA